MIPFNPRDYQRALIDFTLSRRRVMLMAGMGTGKTSSTLSVALARILAGASRRVLVIAPQRVASLTWPDEVSKWDNFNGLTISRITGDAKARNAALTTSADIYTINYENIVWLLKTLGDAWPFDTVIADESTKLKNYRTRQGGQRARALASIAAKTKYWINLTGTPTPNGLKDLWGQVWFIDGGARLGKSYSAFMARWFYSPPGNQYKLLPHAHAFAEIMAAISDICISVEAKDYLDLPPLIENIVRVSLPEKAQDAYDRMEKEFFAELESGAEIEAMNTGVKLNKCLQIASGAIYTDATRKSYETLHDEKLHALADIIDEACGMPVLVAYNFKHELDRLKKYFKQGCEFDRNPATLKAWNAGEIPVMFCHPACLHPATEVLTEFRGWARIVDVLRSERVFDGVEFVAHRGCFFSGVKNVVNVCGIRMTENHKLLIHGEWVEAKHVQGIENAREKARYTYAGDDPIISGMFNLRPSADSARTECKARESRGTAVLHKLFGRAIPPDDWHADMADMARDARTDYRSEQPGLQTLRGCRDFSVRNVARLQSFLRGYVRQLFRRVNVRQDRQPQGLLQGQLPLGVKHGATSEQTEQQISVAGRVLRAFGRVLSAYWHRKNGCLKPTERRYDWGRSDSGLQHQCVSEKPEISEVYDLVDCGPRNRFVIRNSAGEAFISHNSAGHGLSMQDGGNILAFFGSDWNLETHAQMIERIGPTRQAQSGYNRPVYVHHIVTAGTVDELVLDVKHGKASVQDAVMQRLKQRNEVSK